MDNFNFNVFNIIIISGVIHGIIFSLIVITQKKHLLNNTVYLGLTVLFLSLSNLQYWLLDTGFTNRYQILSLVFIPWQWLILPMFYLYVHRFIGRNKVGRKTIFLLITPFCLVLLIHISQIVINHTSDNIYKLVSHFQRGIYIYLEFLSFIFNMSIIYIIYKMILKHEKDDSFDIKWIKSETNWLKKLVYTGLIICTCWFAALLIVVIYNLNKSYMFYPLWIGISILVYWIGYVGLNKSTQLRKRIELRKQRILNISKKKKTNNNLPKAFSNFEKQILESKMYLNPNLNLKNISEKLNLSEGYISQIINKNANLNFNEYINTLRIDDAKSMLTNKDYDNYTISAIGLEAGFNSKSSFYSAFKKFTEKTPIEYKKSVRNL